MTLFGKMKTALSLLLLLFAGCSLLAGEPFDLGASIRDADEVTLISLLPQQTYAIDGHGNPTEEEKKKEHFHGYPVLGKIPASQPKEKAMMKDAVLAALASAKNGVALMCFEPRHAVCLRKGDQHVDLLICFECQKLEVRYLKLEAPELRSEFIGIGPGGLDVLNRLLDAQKIKRDLPKKEPNQAPEPTAPSGRGSS
jgi:hypothetical protein